MDYVGIVAPLVVAIQELAATLDNVSARVDELLKKRATKSK